MGSKQLRNKWEMRSWTDLDAMIGDAYKDFCERIRYCIPTGDSNRARWPVHELWRVVTDVLEHDLSGMRSGVVPEGAKEANRAEHKRMLDMQILGLLVSRAAAERIDGDGFGTFMKRHLLALREASNEHPVPLDKRIAKAAGRYWFR